MLTPIYILFKTSANGRIEVVHSCTDRGVIDDLRNSLVTGRGHNSENKYHVHESELEVTESQAFGGAGVIFQPIAIDFTNDVNYQKSDEVGVEDAEIIFPEGDTEYIPEFYNDADGRNVALLLERHAAFYDTIEALVEDSNTEPRIREILKGALQVDRDYEAQQTDEEHEAAVAEYAKTIDEKTMLTQLSRILDSAGLVRKTKPEATDQLKGKVEDAVNEMTAYLSGKKEPD